MSKRLTTWLRKLFRPTLPTPYRRTYRPRLELLEDRLAPATFVESIDPGANNTAAVAQFIADVQTANSNGEVNTITLFPGGTYTFSTPDNSWFGPNALPAISSDLTVMGQGRVIQRSQAADTATFRLFFVSGGPSLGGLPLGHLTLEDVTLTGGVAHGGNSGTGGGGLGAGGAIFNMGDTTLWGVTLTNNMAVGGSTGVAGLGTGGGGIGQDAQGDIGGGFGGAFPGGSGGAGGSAAFGGGGGGGFTANGADANGFQGGNGGGQSALGGIGGHGNLEGLGGDGGGGGGGAPSSAGVGPGGSFGSGGFGGGGDGGGGGVGGGGGGSSGPNGTGGGGGFGGGGGASQNGSFAQGRGGFGGGSGGANGAINRPGAGSGAGGAIFTLYGSLTVVNSTLTGNTAQGGSGGSSGNSAGGLGGAICNLDGSVVLGQDTLAANTVSGPNSAGGALANFAFGNNPDGTAVNATVTLVNSILASSAGGTDLYNIDFDFLGTATVTATGPNIVQSSTGTISGTAPLATDPLLAALGAYGGLTQTLALKLGSPAIDAGSDSGAPGTDQRGQTRIVGAHVDLGAFEDQVVVTAPAAQNATQGVPTSFDLGSFSDQMTGISTWTVSVNWGDNSSSDSFTANSQGSLAVRAHTYASVGPFSVIVTVSDADGNVNTASFQVNVADAPLTAGAVTPPSAVAGTPTGSVVLFHFTDADSGDTASDFTATVTWGDGTVEDNVTNPGDVQVVANSAGGFDVVGTHTYLTATSPAAVNTPGLNLTIDVAQDGGSTCHGEGTVDVSGDAVLNGTTGNDTLTLSAAPGGALGDVRYVLNSGTPITLKNLHSFTFNGLDGADRMTVNFSPGGALVPGAIQFHGGVGSNSLDLNGVASQSIFHTRPGQIAESALGANPVANQQVVTYDSVATLDIDDAAGLNAEAGPDTADRGGLAAVRGGTAFPGGGTALSASEAFVQALYLDGLGRAGSMSELDGWLPLLQSAGQRAVAMAIEGSFEGDDRLVKSWYETFLGRPAQGGEERVWVTQLQAGQSEEQVLSGILSSGELLTRAQQLVSSGTPQQRYVRALYELLLGRTGGQLEIDGWAGTLSDPSTPAQRGQVALSILSGPEFRIYQFEGDFDALLHRPSGSQELHDWVFANLDQRSVRLSFEASSEFFANG